MSDRCPRFVVLEPSKVGPQHITLIEGYLRALLTLDLPARGIDLVYRADPSSHAALSADVREAVRFEAISVLDPEARQWVRKIGQEVMAVREAVTRMRATDILLITCLSSPSLLLVEVGNGLLGDRNVTAVLHGEVEALFDARYHRSWRSWGFWAWRWFRLRRHDSRLKLAVIAGFIGDALAKLAPDRLSAADMRVLPFPVSSADGLPLAAGRHTAVFIGYRTKFKGFDRFAQVASSRAGGLAYVVVGHGQVEEIPAGDVRGFGEAGFIGEVAKASVAVFPYSAGYVASLSAAALDALSTGVHMVATRRPCFEALERELGSDFITLFDSDEDLSALLADTGFLDRARAGSGRRRMQLAETSYGLSATITAFAAMLDKAGYRLQAATMLPRAA